MSSWDSPFLFIGIAKTPRDEALWICDKKLHLNQLGVQLLGCSPLRRLLFLLSGFRDIHAGRRNTGIRYTNPPSDP
ncbi:hypothetical protein GFN53_23085 [Salmonella enterica]|nr:hypothetical protein [Salmonella enterica]ECW1672991.1 hypothetical protein [Salmonella enterica]EDJ9651503.1 hypothetical protein [Salmonella enterica]EDX3728189.1 hypothetical protein [Salmonella enterica subsp. enterica serovar Mississippi]